MGKHFNLKFVDNSFHWTYTIRFSTLFLKITAKRRYGRTFPDKLKKFRVSKRGENGRITSLWCDFPSRERSFLKWQKVIFQPAAEPISPEKWIKPKHVCYTNLRFCPKNKNKSSKTTCLNSWFDSRKSYGPNEKLMQPIMLAERSTSVNLDNSGSDTVWQIFMELTARVSRLRYIPPSFTP